MVRRSLLTVPCNPLACAIPVMPGLIRCLTSLSATISANNRQSAGIYGRGPTILIDPNNTLKN